MSRKYFSKQICNSHHSDLAIFPFAVTASQLCDFKSVYRWRAESFLTKWWKKYWTSTYVRNIEGKIVLTYNADASHEGAGAQLQRMYGIYALSRFLSVPYRHTPLVRQVNDCRQSQRYALRSKRCHLATSDRNRHTRNRQRRVRLRYYKMSPSING